LISGSANLPFAVALFIGNVVSVSALNYLVPWISGRFAWWLQPAGKDTRTTDIAGAALLMALYAALAAGFWLFF
jgi:antibiotic biosynthesis monooxygenase (ABM) superfamily enzyme